MPIEIKIVGENALHAAAEYRGLYEFMQKNVAVPSPDNKLPLKTAEAPAAEEKAPVKTEAAKPAAKGKAKAKEPEAESDEKTVTLEEIMNKVKEIGGDGKNDKIMDKLKGINKSLGIQRITTMPADKFNDFWSELQKEFPDSFSDAEPEAKADMSSIF